MSNRNSFWLAVSALLFSTSIADDQITTIRYYIDAYNKLDIDAMMTYVTEDIQWISESDSSRIIETNGKKELVATLTSYFSQLPSTRSEVANFNREDEKVFVEETAFWENEGELLSQCAVVSYEFVHGYIAAVTYYDSRRCFDSDKSNETTQRDETH